jgi:hypothetical protein
VHKELDTKINISFSNFVRVFLTSAPAQSVHKELDTKTKINISFSNFVRVFLTSAPGALVKESKSSRFYIEKNNNLHFRKVGYKSFKKILPFLIL